MAIDMETRIEKAREYFLAGYNCAQAVSAPFYDLIGMDEKTVLRMASSFGGGFGRLRELCGVLSGIGLIAGILYGDLDPADDSTKAAHYALIQEYTEKFRSINGSIVCRHLLDTPDTRPWPDARTAEYYSTRPCARFVDDGVRILCQLIDSKQAG